MLDRLFVAAALCGALAAQAAQLVGPVLDATAIIRAAPGFGGATGISGACRDNQGNYWTTCHSAGLRHLIRISPAGLVTGFTPTTVSANECDLAFDAQRDRIWIPQCGAPPLVFSSVTGAFVGQGNTSTSCYLGLTWDGSDRIRVSGLAGGFDAATLQFVGGGSPLPGNGAGLMVMPDRAIAVAAAMQPADPAGITACEFQTHPQASTMPPDLTLSGPGLARGGQPRGCEAWLDPATNEWLGVFCQWNPATEDAVLYTARLTAPQGGGCGGARFWKGPSIVQSQVYATADQASGFAFLVVAVAPGSITHPIFGAGCTYLLDPATSFVFGAFLPNPGGYVDGATTIPVSPSLRELPLYFQWATLGFGGSILLSEMRSAAIKQF